MIVAHFNLIILIYKIVQLSGVAQLNTIRFINSSDADMKISDILIHNYT